MTNESKGGGWAPRPLVEELPNGVTKVSYISDGSGSSPRAELDAFAAGLKEHLRKNAGALELFEGVDPDSVDAEVDAYLAEFKAGR